MDANDQSIQAGTGLMEFRDRVVLAVLPELVRDAMSRNPSAPLGRQAPSIGAMAYAIADGVLGARVKANSIDQIGDGPRSPSLVAVGGG